MIPCATCGAAPIGTFNDGSPRYAVSCEHPALRPEQVHPSYAAFVASIRSSEFVDPYGRIVVPLTEDEMAEGAECGKLRLKRAMRRKARDQLGIPSEASHVLGAQGERAFSKWIGRPWECTTARYGGASDVAGCQIRTASDQKKKTVVHESDPARIPVVSIVRSENRFLIRGFVLAFEARLHREWIGDPGERRPAWFVPTEALRPMAEFYATDMVRAALGLPPLPLPKEITDAVPEADAAREAPEASDPQAAARTSSDAAR